MEEAMHGDFRRETEAMDFSARSGVANTVLDKGELAWISDIAADNRFSRASPALSAGLHSVVMAPVAAGTEILGVIEFYGAETAPRDEHMALVIEYVATQLGRVFERDRAERRPGRTRAREQMMLAELSRKAVDVIKPGRVPRGSRAPGGGCAAGVPLRGAGGDAGLHRAARADMRRKFEPDRERAADPRDLRG